MMQWLQVTRQRNGATDYGVMGFGDKAGLVLWCKTEMAAEAVEHNMKCNTLDSTVLIYKPVFELVL